MSERLRDVLAAHGPSGTVNSREGWVECECGERLHLPSGLTFDGYPEMWDEERKARDAHVEAAVLAWLDELLGGDEAREVVAGSLFAWNTPHDPFFVIGGRTWGDPIEGDPYEPIAAAALAAVRALVTETSNEGES